MYVRPILQIVEMPHCHVSVDPQCFSNCHLIHTTYCMCFQLFVTAQERASHVGTRANIYSFQSSLHAPFRVKQLLDVAYRIISTHNMSKGQG